MGKGAWHPTWPSEFSALDPRGGRIELMASVVLWCPCVGCGMSVSSLSR